MIEEKIELIIGGLLHDIGKVVYRQGDGRKHSISGYEFLKDEVHLKNTSVLDSVKYHHGEELAKADISEDSFAYITYIADNIASAADRRKNDSEEKGFQADIALESVFNILNNNDKKYHYKKGFLENTEINYPTDKKDDFDEHFYLKVKENIYNNLLGIEWTGKYMNSLLEILEANLTYIPSSTAKGELADISLYDHMKLTAAINSCIYDYLTDKKIENFKKTLFLESSKFYSEKAFLLYSLDISGIQSFIYTIHSEGALKMLRARSFYLEIMMETIIDAILERLELSRANLIYSGGGHCYLLLANTTHTINQLNQLEKELNEWLLEVFDVSLYVAGGYALCSADDLKNNPKGSYSEIFRTITNMISEKKSNRYTARQIMTLNQRKKIDHTRECKVCKRTDNLNDKNECTICSAISKLSKNILYTDFFTIIRKQEEGAVPLPFQCYMLGETEGSLKKRMKSDTDFVRVYGKNKLYSGKNMSTKLWVGNYTTGETFEELAEQAEGIKRIGILRADVDNLGKAFVSGFESEKNGSEYVTLSRTATLSRQLSMFFKYHINDILNHPKYSLNGNLNKERKATIVYSGGDDLFIVGAWNDVLELAVDIRNAFKEYTEGTLSLSAGIGIYQPGFPIHVSAKEVANLEDDSKNLPNKNAITILPDGEKHIEIENEIESIINDATYSWDTFINEVIGEKYQIIYNFFQTSNERGKNFLYHLLELIRSQEDKINLARYIYLLARMEPDEREDAKVKEQYKIFSKNMYQWIKNQKDCRQLKTAITLYAYMIREDVI